MADDRGKSGSGWSWFWTTLARAWAWFWQTARRGWILCTLLAIAAFVSLVFHGTKQPDISTIPTYLIADQMTPDVAGDGGTNYCTSLGSALVKYSAYSRICAWTTFFLGVLLGGIAVVIGSDDQVPSGAGIGQRLLHKHRNVGLLLLAALSWITAYSSFVRIGTASETVEILTTHISSAETRRANGRSLLAPPSRLTLQAASPENQATGSVQSAASAQPIGSMPPAASAAPAGVQPVSSAQLAASTSPAGSARSLAPRSTPEQPGWSRDGSGRGPSEERHSRMDRALRDFNETLDRELFAQCVAARGSWEVSRTKSLEFAQSVALGRAQELFDHQKEAEKVVESANLAQDKHATATENVKNAETLKDELRALIVSQRPPPDATLNDSSQKLADAAAAAAKAAADAERATSRAVNLTAGIDPAMAAALRTSVSDLRDQVTAANQAAATAQEAAKDPAQNAADKAGKVVEQAEKAARAASQALELATNVNDTVQAAAAAPASKP